jgi:hypothetical protein
VTASQVVARIKERHRDDDLKLAAFPDEDNLHAVAEFALRRRTGLAPPDARANIVDALLLLRFAQEDTERLTLRGLLAAMEDRVKTRELTPATGIKTRQGHHDRVNALTRKRAAARLRVTEDTLTDPPDPTKDPGRSADLVREVAEQLLACWSDLTTNNEIDEWLEGIHLTLKHPGPHSTASLVTQMRHAVADIESFAADAGQRPWKNEKGRSAVSAVRALCVEGGGKSTK